MNNGGFIKQIIINGSYHHMDETFLFLQTLTEQWKMIQDRSYMLLHISWTIEGYYYTAHIVVPVMYDRIIILQYRSFSIDDNTLSPTALKESLWSHVD